MTSAYLLEDKGQSLVEVVLQPPREHLLFLWRLRVEPGSNQPLHVHIFITASDHWLGSPHRPFTMNSGSLTELQITYTLSSFCMNWMRNIISISKWYSDKGDISTKTKINSYNQGDKIQWWNRCKNGAEGHKLWGTNKNIKHKDSQRQHTQTLQITSRRSNTKTTQTNTADHLKKIKHKDNTHKRCRSPQEDQTQRQHTQTLQITSRRSSTKTTHTNTADHLRKIKHKDNTHKRYRSPQEDKTQRQHTQTLRIPSGRQNTKPTHTNTADHLKKTKHKDNTHKHCGSPQEDKTQRQHTQTLRITSGRSCPF